MCGVAGYWAPRRRYPHRLLVEMSEALTHRGPDDHGYLSLVLPHAEGAVPGVTRHIDPAGAANLGLAHRRLSILDVSEAGQQPMGSPDRRIWLSYNGEVYNYLELRTELANEGFTFSTGTDTEVIIAAYRAWGDACFRRFTGMFALALVDLDRRRLLLARDHFGIKPLYYHRTDERIIFASELKALTMSAGLRDVDPQVAFDYLAHAQVDHREETFIHGVYQVPAAHFLEIDMSAPNVRIDPTRFWSIDLDRRRDATPQEAADEFRRLFMDSVTLHLRSDVPLGSCLSGGLDSSAIVCAVAELVGTGAERHTFSYVAREAGIDESAFADLVNRHTGATGHRIESDPVELVSDMRELIRVQDYPFASTSIYAQARVFGLAKDNGIRVMLDGQGADELLAGYRSYLGAHFTQMLVTGRLAALGRSIARAVRQPDVSPAMLALWTGAVMVPQAWHRAARAVVREPVVPPWLRSDWVDTNVQQVVRDRTGVKNRRHALREYMAHQLTVSSLPALLRYEDRNSMAYSIESRVPFLTPAIAEFLFALPDDEVLRDGVTKPVLRRAMRGLVPDAILDRKDKIGFATPERTWLVGPLADYVRKTLTSDVAHEIPALEPTKMLQEFERVAAGTQRFSFTTWRWINLIEWTRTQNVRWG